MSRYEVVVTTPAWTLTGVNTFTLNLVRGLRGRGIEAGIVVTRPDKQDLKPLDPPSDVPFELMPLIDPRDWRSRWRALIDLLETRAPCVYIPNHDYFHSCISPRLSAEVGIVGIAHSDHENEYDHAVRLGRYWNAIVCVSRAVEETLVSLAPALADRIAPIRPGVQMPEGRPERDFSRGGEIRVLCSGTLANPAKRTSDLLKVAEGLGSSSIPARLTMLGTGADQDLGGEARRLADAGLLSIPGILPYKETLSAYEEHDVFILTSEYEGMPLALIEAMSRGCVPIVTDIRSGVPELINDGENGFIVPIGDIDAFVDRIGLLRRDSELRRRMSAAAYETVVQKGFTLNHMVDEYVALFDRVMADALSGSFVRPRGRIRKPPMMRKTFRQRLVALWAAGLYVASPVTRMLRKKQ